MVGSQVHSHLGVAGTGVYVALKCSCALLVAITCTLYLYVAKGGELRWNLWKYLCQQVQVTLRRSQAVELQIPCRALLPVANPAVGIQVKLVSCR